MGRKPWFFRYGYSVNELLKIQKQVELENV